jgi:hypothetical protein
MPNALLQYQPITSSIFILLRLQLRSPPIRSRKHLDHVTRPSQKILFSRPGRRVWGAQGPHRRRRCRARGRVGGARGRVGDEIADQIIGSAEQDN